MKTGPVPIFPIFLKQFLIGMGAESKEKAEEILNMACD